MNVAQAVCAHQSRKAPGNPASKAQVGTHPVPKSHAGFGAGGKTARSNLSLHIIYKKFCILSTLDCSSAQIFWS